MSTIADGMEPSKLYEQIIHINILLKYYLILKQFYVKLNIIKRILSYRKFT